MENVDLELTLMRGSWGRMVLQCGMFTQYGGTIINSGTSTRGMMSGSMPFIKRLRESLYSLVKRISNSVVQVICRHANFFLQYIEYTYIRVYASEENPLLLPKYASDRLVLMEFARQLLFLKERTWR